MALMVREVDFFPLSPLPLSALFYYAGGMARLLIFVSGFQLVI